MSQNLEEIEEFKIEALELLDMAEKSLLSLDLGSEFSPAFDAVFRGFHNFTSAAGMMELTDLQHHTHELETILMAFKGQQEMPKEYISFFLNGIDAAKTLLNGEKISFKYEVNSQNTESSHASSQNENSNSSPNHLLSQTNIPLNSELSNETNAEEGFSEFKSECEEILQRLNLNLQSLDKGNASKDIIDDFYRDIHSLKGGAFLFSQNLLGEVSHHLESSLEVIRSGTHQINKEYIDSLYEGLNYLETLASYSGLNVPDAIQTQVIRFIDKLQLTTSGLKLLSVGIDSMLKNDIESNLSSSNEFQPTKNESSSPVFETPIPQINTESVKIENQIQPKEPVQNNQIKVEPIMNTTKKETTSNNNSPLETKPKNNESEAEGASTIRVPVALLDNLMTLMGEMVLVRNQVLQFSNKSEDLEFLSMSKRLNVVTSEIQGEMMKTRMQPLSNVLNKFNRVVRDLSNELHKKISLTIVGAETELDKSLLEAIKDPLTHIVRNSCDHGIETPEIRKSNGKPDVGQIKIRAYHEGGQVIIDIIDDGKGLDKDIVIQKAIEKGLVSATDASKFNEKQIFNLIFAPGFSTAKQITNVSGRGVGMDVVRTNIEKIGGTVDLSSQTGQGTTIKLKIPLTLAIVPALIVKSGEETFAIPQVKLEELVRVDQSSKDQRIEFLHGAPIYRLRGNLLPLVDLNRVLKLSDKNPSDYSTGSYNIAVLNAEHCSFGLIIDEIQDTADIVVKPINKLLKNLSVYSGATILGNGSVALILDVLGLSKVALLGSSPKNKEHLTENTAQSKRSYFDNQDYLLVELNSKTKHGIVLNYVHRIEEFNKNQIEFSGSQKVVRYRDVILPIISVNEQLGYPSEISNKNSEVFPVIVIEKSGSLYGLCVNHVIDTLSTPLDIDMSHKSHECIFGNLNTENELISVIDPFQVIRKCFPDDSKSPSNEIPTQNIQISHQNSVSQNRNLKVLLVEDTLFFRNAIRKILEPAGIQVVLANDGVEALTILNSGEHKFDTIISDIEMPRKNGFELAKDIRLNSQFSKIPLMAVSSRSDQKYMNLGKEAGFDLYLEKLNPKVLIQSIFALSQKHKDVA